MFKDPWIRYGMLGGIGFVLGWAIPEYLLHAEISWIPLAGGFVFFIIAALLFRRYAKHIQK